MSFTERADHRELVLTSNCPGTVINYVYRMPVDLLDASSSRALPDGGIMVICLRNERCVDTYEAETGKSILHFQFVEFGPFPKERLNADEGAVRRLIELAKMPARR